MMGFFSYAYVVEGTVAPGGVRFAATAYRAEGPVLFSWGPGKRAAGLSGLADDTLFCETALAALPVYPRRHHESADGAEPALYRIEESFFAPERNEPVLFHFVLPPRFVPRPEVEPFKMPEEASLAERGDRLTITVPAVGGGDLRFTIGQLTAGEQFSDYELSRILRPQVEKTATVGFELNLGIVKFTLKS